VLCLRASGGVGSSRKRETNVLVPLVSAGRPHRRQAVDGDLPPLSVFWPAGPAGRQVRASVAAGALHRVHQLVPGVDLNWFFRKYFLENSLNDIKSIS